MNDFVLVGHCGKIANWCLPKLVDDLCVDCPINSWRDEEE